MHEVGNLLVPLPTEIVGIPIRPDIVGAPPPGIVGAPPTMLTYNMTWSPLMSLPTINKNKISYFTHESTTLLRSPYLGL